MPQQPIETSQPPVPAPIPSPDPNGEALRRAEEEFCKTLPPILVQSRLAFRRDLPQLLRDYPRHWVAYSGDRRIGEPDRSQAKLWQLCVNEGLKPGNFLVLAIEPMSAFFVSEVDL